MTTTIRSNAHAHKVASHLDARMSIGQTAALAGFSITKVDDREFVVAGAGVNPHNNKYLACELADCIIWPNRKAWNVAIKAAN